jgi:hypothetical protein
MPAEASNFAEPTSSSSRFRLRWGFPAALIGVDRPVQRDFGDLEHPANFAMEFFGSS